MRLGFAMIVSASLAGCMSDATGSASGPQSRASGSCVISGCADQICAEQPQLSSCIWYADYVCYETASCGRQADGTCGWIATPALTSCLAMHPR